MEAFIKIILWSLYGLFAFVVYRSVTALKSREMEIVQIKKIRCPGTAVILVLFVVAFTAKFLLSLQLAMHKDLRSDAFFCALWGSISGVVDGIFWGGFAVHLQLARKDAPYHRLW